MITCTCLILHMFYIVYYLSSYLFITNIYYFTVMKANFVHSGSNSWQVHEVDKYNSLKVLSNS